jgi:hypothetical protein
VWCKYVDGVNIFPKLSVHIGTHRESFERNQRVKDCVECARSGQKKLDELKVSLAPLTPANTARVEIVDALPSIQGVAAHNCNMCNNRWYSHWCCCIQATSRDGETEVVIGKNVQCEGVADANITMERMHLHVMVEDMEAAKNVNSLTKMELQSYNYINQCYMSLSIVYSVFVRCIAMQQKCITI